MMNFGTDSLRSFVAVAEMLNFTRAAESAHKTQSAVSQQIRKLEEDLGVSLFERKGRGVQLTLAGETFLPHARRVLTVCDEAVSSVAAPELTGLVRVGLSDALAMTFFPEILKRFAGHSPGMRVETHCGDGDELQAKLAGGELDLFMTTSIRAIPSWEVIARTPLLWVGSNRHFAYKEDPLPLAMYLPGCSYREHAVEALHKAGRAYRLAYSSPSLAGIHVAIASGMAVSALITSSLPPNARLLGVEEGFPPLPLVNVYLVRAVAKGRGVECFCSLATEVVRQGEGMLPSAAPVRAARGEGAASRVRALARRGGLA